VAGRVDVRFGALGIRPGDMQWAGLGMYLRTVMLLLRAEDLHSCPQTAWSCGARQCART
jgi:hypothetical protein